MSLDPKQHWEGIYQNKSPLEVSWYQREPGTSLALIDRAGAGVAAHIADIGGGASVLVDRLLARGYRRLTVVDLSGAALAVARARLGAAAAQVTWVEDDVTAFVPAVPLDLWHDRACFHFFTDAALRARYVAALQRALRPGGHAIIAAFAPGGPLRCSNLDIVQYDAPKLAHELGRDFAHIESVEENHRTPAGKDQLFGFHRFRRA